MTRSFLFALLLFCAACATQVEVSLFPLDLSATSPVLTRLVVLTQTEAETEPAVSTVEPVNESLPLSFGLLLPARFAGQVVQIEVQGFVGEALIYRGFGTLTPGQKEVRLSAHLCSNGSVEGEANLVGEVCDDANLFDGDGCDSNCTFTGCGNGIHHQGEFCIGDPSGVDALPAPRAATLADLDGDGLLDLVTAHPESDRILLFAGDGERVRTLPGISVDSPIFVEAANLAGDEKPDLVALLQIAPGATTLLTSFINQSAPGEFVFEQTGVVPMGSVTAIALGDLDGDGDQDLAGVSAGGQAEVQFNNGTGNFGGRVAFTAGSQPSALALVDLDEDGDLDLVVVNKGSNSVSLFENNGSGGFAQVGVPVLVGSQAPTAISVGDVDGDGVLDIAVANQTGGTVSLLGVQDKQQPLSYEVKIVIPAGLSPVAVSLQDFNGDELLDITTLNQDEDSVAVLLNEGGLQFSEPERFNAGARPAVFSLTDFNRDDLPDIAAIGDDGVVLLLSAP